MIRKGYAILIIVACQIISFLVGLQIFLELPPDWALSETKIQVRIMIPFISIFAGLAGAAIIIHLLGGIELTEQEREKARKEKESGLGAVGLGFLLLGTLALLASSIMPEHGKTEMQMVGILLLIGGSLVARDVIYLLFSVVSVILVYAGYPQIPAIILAIPFLLLSWFLAKIKKGGKETVQHYDERGIYRGYSRRHGDKIEHYDERGIYIGYSIQQGNKIIRYDKEGRYIGEQEEKRPSGRA